MISIRSFKVNWHISISHRSTRLLSVCIFLHRRLIYIFIWNAECSWDVDTCRFLSTKSICFAQGRRLCVVSCNCNCYFLVPARPPDLPITLFFPPPHPPSLPVSMCSQRPVEVHHIQRRRRAHRMRVRDERADQRGEWFLRVGVRSADRSPSALCQKTKALPYFLRIYRHSVAFSLSQYNSTTAELVSSVDCKGALGNIAWNPYHPIIAMAFDDRKDEDAQRQRDRNSFRTVTFGIPGVANGSIWRDLTDNETIMVTDVSNVTCNYFH